MKRCPVCCKTLPLRVVVFRSRLTCPSCGATLVRGSRSGLRAALGGALGGALGALIGFASSPWLHDESGLIWCRVAVLYIGVITAVGLIALIAELVDPRRLVSEKESIDDRSTLCSKEGEDDPGAIGGRGATVAMALVDILGTITMDFSKGSRLTGGDHQDAFHAAFAFAMNLLPALAGEYKEVIIESSSVIENGDIPVRMERRTVRKAWRKRTRYLYAFDARTFSERQEQIARALYLGLAHEYHVRPDSERSLDVLVSTHHIYFHFSAPT